MRPISKDLSSTDQRGAIVLWVEDRLTKEYLYRLWQPQDKMFDICVANGRDTVKAVTSEKRTNKNSNVFGLIDRDFEKTNFEKWSLVRSNDGIFKTRVFEIENYLLDWEILEKIYEKLPGKTKKTDFIKKKAEQFAKSTLWWLVCRHAVVELREKFLANFPKHPKQSIDNRSKVFDFITQQKWYQEIDNRMSIVRNPKELNELIDKIHYKCNDIINSENLNTEFPGKEIFRNIKQFLIESTYTSNDEIETDLAKNIADLQRNLNSHVSDDLIGLKDILLRMS